MSNAVEKEEDKNFLFVSVYDRYSKKYNLLAGKMESKGICTSLLDEILELKGELNKAAINIKIEEVFKI